MSTPEPQSEGLGIGMNEILFILFRHKWKILTGVAAGLIGVLIYLLLSPVYESHAKLLVRYVVERSAIDPVDPQIKTTNGGINNDNVINSEVEILTSADLGDEVAQAVGVERLARALGCRPTRDQVAHAISLGLTVTALKASNVISITYRNSDPELARKVLTELVERYFDKHLQVHRSLGAFSFVSQQTDQVRNALHQTEESLKRLRAQSGGEFSGGDAAAFKLAITKNRDELRTAEVDLAEQRARVREVESILERAAHAKGSTASSAKAPGGDPARYDEVNARINSLRQRQQELLYKYTPSNRMVRITKAQAENLERQRRVLEPSSRAPGMAAGQQPGREPVVDLLTERAKLAASEARVVQLNAQMHSLQERAERINNLATDIARGERNRELEEANYRYFQASLEKARIDEALDPSKIPNISIVQKPTPALIDTSHQKNTVLALAGGGMAIGLFFALLIELLLDPTVNRPMELESRYRIPLLASIPYLPPDRNGSSNGDYSHAIEPSPDGGRLCNLPSALRPFLAAIRDRLVLQLQSDRTTKRPKLIAVTGISEGCGATIIATGLADALVEMGDGNTLLVAIGIQEQGIHPYLKQRVQVSLNDIMREGAPGAPSALRVATIASSDGGDHLPIKRLQELLPDLKRSSFDYIIFDMPPLNRTTATLPLVRYMDKVLLVIEAEKDSRAAIRRAYTDFACAKANISPIFNKCRSHAPHWIQS